MIPAIQSRPRLRWLTGLLYAVVLLWMAVMAWNVFAKNHALILLMLFWFVSSSFVLAHGVWKALIFLFRGVQCPTCRGWGMRCLAAVSFGHRYYRCGLCGQRCKRAGGDESPWLDASGIEDGDMYKPVPYFGPGRRREAWLGGLKFLGAILGFVCLAAIVALIGSRLPWWGTIVLTIPVYFVFTKVSAFRAVPKNILPIRTPLWDSEVDIDADAVPS